MQSTRYLNRLRSAYGKVPLTLEWLTECITKRRIVLDDQHCIAHNITCEVKSSACDAMIQPSRMDEESSGC